MKLISDIINELVDSEKSISSPLLKTKVLASRLQNNVLLDWVTNELRGYENFEKLPDYRKFSGSITGTVISGNTQYDNLPIPTIGLDKEIEESLHSMYFDQSVTALENLVSDNESGMIEHVFQSEISGYLQNNWQERNGNKFLRIVHSKKSISTSAINQLLSVVRNNLLDFMLKIDSEFGNLTEIEELKNKKTEISTIMNQTIINTSGDGNIVNTGNKAKIEAQINISKGNKEQLKNRLAEIGISDKDSEELIEIIDTEEPNSERKTFGEKVNTWIGKMLSKALDGSWNIGIGAAGSLLSEAISKFYGI